MQREPIRIIASGKPGNAAAQHFGDRDPIGEWLTANGFIVASARQ